MKAIAILGAVLFTLTGCFSLLGPPHRADLAALDTCAPRRDALHDEIRTEVEWSLREGHTLAGAIGGMEVIGLRSRAAHPADAPELWYLRMAAPAHPLGRETAVAAGPRLMELRQCLASRGYVFADRSTAAVPVQLTKVQACTVEARRAGASQGVTPGAYEYYVGECLKR